MEFVESQNAAINYRWAEGQYERLPGLAADFVRGQVAAIVTMGGEASALVAKDVTPSVLIGSDPVKSGPWELPG